MHKRVTTHASAFLLLASFGATACTSDSGPAAANVTGPSAFAAGAATSSVTAHPNVITAEFQATATCRAEAPFDARLNVTVAPIQDLFVRRFGFEFLDGFGRRAVPLAFPGTIESSNSVLLPVSLPTTHPIPFPGQVPLSSVAVQAGGFFRLPFRLRFDCGVPARGTLFVSVETADRRGTVDVSRITAQIR